MAKSNVETTITGGKVIYRRYFDAPIELVFDAWSSHQHLSEWWGPDGFTLTTHSLDFTNGGFWNFIMHGPDGTDYNNKIQFVEISKPNLIIYKHIGEGQKTEDVHFHTQIKFEKMNNGTTVIMEQDFGTKEELEKVNEQYGAIEGGIQHIDNLGKYLESLK
ncbi:MAG: SRPBCC domain-containing protein [Halobacteriovoraceae bacterium]|nr:SRPBCC domain-containing protein [Halobacteriovoraceae bacterium]MCB9095341.1 SRPBCC domain-containing protein [Halobacteriovoraceae bacterium]